jgi:hypothetical protein
MAYPPSEATCGWLAQLGPSRDTQPFIGLRKIHMGACLKSRKSGYGHVLTVEFHMGEKRQMAYQRGFRAVPCETYAMLSNRR